MKRVFIAIDCSKKLRATIEEWQNSHRQLPVRWIGGSNLHVTLLPPWDEENTDGLCTSLYELKDVAHPFNIAFHTIAYGPTSNDPRLIWAEGHHSQELSQMKHVLENKLHQISQNRPFTPHITLARFRPEQFRGFSVKVLHEKIQWVEHVSSFVLMESRLLPNGAEYEILARVSL